MKTNSAATARRQLDRRLSGLRADYQRHIAPPRGWIRAIRDALGMTASDLGRRMGVSQAAVTQFEKSEKDDAITLKSLRSAAEALDCTLLYAFVPRRALEDLMRERASSLADQQLARAHHTMTLENQALLPDDLAAERSRLIDEILRGDPSLLWRQCVVEGQQPSAKPRRGNEGAYRNG